MTNTTTNTSAAEVPRPDAETLAKVARMTDENDHTHARFYIATWGEVFATSPDTRARLRRYRLIFGRIHHYHERAGHLTETQYKRRERVLGLMMADMSHTELAEAGRAFWACL